MSPQVEVRRADGDTSRALFRLRFRIFRETVGDRLDAVARDDKLEDDLDAIGTNYVAIDSARNVVGGFRSVALDALPAQSPALRAWNRVLDLPRVETFFPRAQIAQVGRLAVDPAFRMGGTVAMALIARATADMVGAGTRVVVADCTRKLLPLYAHCGCFVHGEPFVDPVFGSKVPLISLLRDRELLFSLRSPLFRVIESSPDDAAGRDWMISTYGLRRLELGRTRARRADEPPPLTAIRAA